MLTLIRQVECFCPKYIGRRDILVAGGKIYKIAKPGGIEKSALIEDIFDFSGSLALPGIIDQHVHIIGGGGEQGFISRTGEVSFDEIISSGVTTIVGTLGADSYTRGIANLFAKAKELGERGITSYIYTGSYALPAANLTGTVEGDIIFIDKIIGAGEIAISDHRSTFSDINDFKTLCMKVHVAGMIGNKAGVVHIHVGDGNEGLMPIIEAIKGTNLSVGQLVPTHVNRNARLFSQAVKYCKMGGNIDLTAGESRGVSVPDGIEALLKSGADIKRVTVSSDAGGSMPGRGAGRMAALYEDIIRCIVDKRIKSDLAFSLASENVARILKLYPKKGALKEGSDADILIVDRGYNIKKVFAKGKILY